MQIYEEHEPPVDKAYFVHSCVVKWIHHCDVCTRNFLPFFSHYCFGLLTKYTTLTLVLVPILVLKSPINTDTFNWICELFNDNL